MITVAVAVEVTGVRIDVKARRHPVSRHDAVLDLSVDPHVGIFGLDLKNKCPRRLVLKDGSVQTGALTLEECVICDSICEFYRTEMATTWTK